MAQGFWALVLGLLGGVAGAFVVTKVIAPAATGPGPATEVARTDPQVLDRLAKLESAADPRTESGPRLQGRPAPDGSVPGAAEGAGEAALEEVATAVLGRIEGSLDARVKTALEKLEAERKAAERASARPARRRLALAEVAREVGLSAREEDALRQIYADANQKMMEMFAKPDGDVEQVKQDLESFKNDPKARPKLMSKYVPKLLTNVGEMMAVEAEKEEQVKQVLGEERQDLLQGYDIVEERPFDFTATMGVEAGPGR